jgi:hypothetical protein
MHGLSLSARMKNNRVGSRDNMRRNFMNETRLEGYVVDSPEPLESDLFDVLDGEDFSIFSHSLSSISFAILAQSVEGHPLQSGSISPQSLKVRPSLSLGLAGRYIVLHTIS